jgi:uncharacterized membrane protein
MKARDWFGLIIRVIGLVLLLYSAWYFIWVARGIFTGGDYGIYFVQGAGCFVVGVLLLVLARFIVRLCYSDNKDDSDA